MTTLAHDHVSYSLDEAATYLGCSRLTLRDQVTRGEVPHHRTGRVKGVYFTDDDIREIRALNARPVQHAPSRRKGRTRPNTPPAASVAIPEEFARLKGAR